MEELMIPQNQNQNPNKGVVNKGEIYLLVSSVLLGILFVILFYKKPLGISYLIFAIAFYLVFLGNLRHKIAFKYNFAWFLSIPIIALSSTYFIFSNQIFAALNFIIIPILIIAQTILIIEGNKHQWYESKFINDVFYGIFNRTLGNISKPFVIALNSLRIRKSPEKYDVLKKILIGLAISMPLLFIIISLLASADRVFKHLIDKISSSFGSINIGDFSIQGMIALLIAMIVFSYIWSFSNPNNRIETQGQLNSQETTSKSWDPIISITVLIAINCVYLVFTVIQFAYMFDSLNNALPPDFTYAEYARRGFFELLMVTLINFSIVLSSIRFTRKDSNWVARIVQILHSLLILCTVVILVSAYFRMSLYEAVYGYTYLRVLTQSFMIFLFVLFLIAFYKIWNERISLLKPYIVLGLIAYLILNFTNIDVLITNKNIERYHKTGKLDAHYLRNLSYDSIPVLVNLHNDGNAPYEIRKNLMDQQKELSIKQPWQAFNLSKYKAKQVLSEVKF